MIRTPARVLLWPTKETNFEIEFAILLLVRRLPRVLCHVYHMFICDLKVTTLFKPIKISILQDYHNLVCRICETTKCY